MQEDNHNTMLPIDEMDMSVAQGRLVVLSKQNLTSITAGSFLAPLGTALVLFISNFNKDTFLVWLGVCLTIGIGRILHHREFRTFQELGKPMHQWQFELILLAMLSGLSWAAASILFVDPENTSISVFVIISILALISGGTNAYSSHPNIFLSFSLSLWLPTLFYFLYQNERFYYEISFLVSLFLGWNIFTVFNKSMSITENIRLQTENTKLLYELKYQRVIAEEANKAKSRFLAAASHDLRQPLHAMGLFADGLTLRIKNPEAMEILGSLKRSMDTLRNLFDSLLDISRLDAGVIKVDSHVFCLTDMIQRLNIEYEVMAKDKGLRYRSHLRPAWLDSDPTLVEQMLRNLMANAIKYTQEGGVLIGMRFKGSIVRIEVWDTGIGIAKEHQKQVFEEFNQVNNPERDRSQGIGLGLSILKRTASLLGTRIGISSKLGSGSKFYIELAMADTPMLSEDRPSTEFNPDKEIDLDLSGVSVLVVDDEADIRAALHLKLKDWGCQVKTAYSIESAVRSLDDFNPDILLTDYRLSIEETGDRVIKAIHENIGYEIPSIIITGTAMAESIKNIEELKVTVLYKPLEPLELNEKMIYALNRSI